MFKVIMVNQEQYKIGEAPLLEIGRKANGLVQQKKKKYRFVDSLQVT